MPRAVHAPTVIGQVAPGAAGHGQNTLTPVACESGPQSATKAAATMPAASPTSAPAAVVRRVNSPKRNTARIGPPSTPSQRSSQPGKSPTKANPTARSVTLAQKRGSSARTSRSSSAWSSSSGGLPARRASQLPPSRSGGGNHQQECRDREQPDGHGPDRRGTHTGQHDAANAGPHAVLKEPANQAFLPCTDYPFAALSWSQSGGEIRGFCRPGIAACQRSAV